MNEGVFAIAFAAGMVAAFNPCGFAMLPAYLGYFLGLDDESSDSSGRILRALAVASALTAGFVVVFGIIGMILSYLEVQIFEHLPWITMIIGVGLVGLGIAMLRGFQMTVALPKLDKGAGSRQLTSMFLFGVSYAVASLSCTLPIFMAQVTNTFRLDSFWEGLASYVAYGLGMGLVLMVLTLLMALAKGSMVHGMKRVLPYVDRVAGGLLVVAGAYVAYYGWYELQVYADNTDVGGPAEQVTGLQSDITTWINDVGAGRIGLVLGSLVVAALLVATGLRYDRRTYQRALAAHRDSERSSDRALADQHP